MQNTLENKTGFQKYFQRLNLTSTLTYMQGLPLMFHPTIAKFKLTIGYFRKIVQR